MTKARSSFEREVNEAFERFIASAFRELIAKEDEEILSDGSKDFFAVRLPRAYMERLERIAQDWHVTNSDVGRLALAKGIKATEEFLETHCISGTNVSNWQWKRRDEGEE